MRIGLRLPPCRPAGELAAACAQAEELGYDAVWFPDSQLLWRDVWVVAALAAERTTDIGLGVAVTNVETRHPSVTASAIRTVQELAPGRLRVGIGTGNSSLGLLGVRPTPRAALAERLDQLRHLLAGDELELGGGVGRLRDPAGPTPLYMAASGPQNLRFAGARADGVILLSGVSIVQVERSLGLVHEGSAAAGRDAADVPVVVSAFAHVTDDIERDARMLKPLCAALAVGGAAQALAAEGVEVTAPPLPLAGVYPDLVHAEDWAGAVAAVSPYVSDAAAVRFAERFCLFGPIATIRARLAEVAAAGVAEVLVQHVGSYDLPSRLMREFAAVHDRGAALLP